MAIIKCKMCGGDMELSADCTFGTCEYCGSTMTLPKVTDDQRAAAFNRGNHFRRIGEFDKALAVYERIVSEDDTDAEAHWCCALCRFGIEYVEDPGTYEYLPTCHRVSFDSFLEDVDYLAAVKYSDGITRRQYQKDAANIAEVQKGILATSQNEAPFDIFICYKETGEDGNRTRDSLLAQDIYYQLTEQGRRVFFARITLEDKVGSQYEPYIFAALNSARVMVVVGTKPEHLNAVWVKNEWSRFLAMMKKDRSKLLLPCYRDMDPYDLPEQLSVLQSYDMSKIGFLQDLTRGIAKVLDAGKKSAPVETVVVQQGSTNVTALLKRGNMALEDGDWVKADEFFEEVLNQDAECAEAYVGKALAAEKAKTLDALVTLLVSRFSAGDTQSFTLSVDAEHPRQMARDCVVPGYLDQNTIAKAYDFTTTYRSGSASWAKQRKDAETWWRSNRHLSRAEKFAKGACAKSLTDARQSLLSKLDQKTEEAKQAANSNLDTAKARHQTKITDTDAMVQEKAANARKKREEDYAWALRVLNQGTDVELLKKASGMLSKMGPYEDAEDLAKKCRTLADDLTAEANARAAAQAEELARRQAEEERLRKEKEEAEAREKAAKKKRTTTIAAISAIAVIIVIAVLSPVLRNAQMRKQYENAVALMNEGNYEQALVLFDGLTGYEDSDTLREQAAAAQEAAKLREETAATYEKALQALEDGDDQTAYDLLYGIQENPDAQELLKHFRLLPLTLQITYSDYNSSATFTYSYNSDGTIASDVGDYGSSKEERIYHYDGDGHLTSIECLVDDGSTLIYEYDIYGNLLRGAYSDSPEASWYYEYTYLDDTGRPSVALYYYNDPQQVQRITYEYDADGKIAKQTIEDLNDDGTTLNTSVWTFDYYTEQRTETTTATTCDAQLNGETQYCYVGEFFTPVDPYLGTDELLGSCSYYRPNEATAYRKEQYGYRCFYCPDAD